MQLIRALDVTRPKISAPNRRSIDPLFYLWTEYPVAFRIDNTIEVLKIKFRKKKMENCIL